MILQTIDAVKQMFNYLKHNEYVGFDTETTGLLCHGGEIAGWCFGTEEHSFYIPVKHTKSSLALSRGYVNLPADEIAGIVHNFFREIRGTSTTIIGHNLKFDFGMAAKTFYPIGKAHKMAYNLFSKINWFDTMVMVHLLDENEMKGLKPVCKRLFNDHNNDEKELKTALSAIKKKRKADFLLQYLESKKGNKKIWKPGKEEAEKLWVKNYVDNYADAPIPACGKYGKMDIVRTLKVFDWASKQFTKPYNKGLDVALKVEQDVILPTVAMELRGLAADKKYYEELIPEYEYQMFTMLQQMAKIGGREFNPTASKDKYEVLKGLGAKGFMPTDKAVKNLTPHAKAKGYANVHLWFKADSNAVENHPEFIPSTGKKSLKNVAKVSNEKVQTLVLLINNYAKLSKIITTYLRPLVRYNREGVIRASLNPLGTVTGRYSSSDPNMQNQPKDDPVARKGFTRRKDYINFYFDYDQMEMRLAAHFCNCPKLIELFEKGLDPYTYLAAIGEHLPYEEVPKSIRGVYKIVGLMTLYGAGVDSVSIFTDEADRILEVMYQEFPELKGYQVALEDMYDHYQYIEILYGRRRRLLSSRDKYKLLNSKIQGAGAMMVKKAITRCYRLLHKTRSNILLTVHDELVFEIHYTELYLVREIKRIMEDFKTVIPCTVGIDYSLTNWADKKEWKGELTPDEFREVQLAA